jgi:putative Holliday junction resolvase
MSDIPQRGRIAGVDYGTVRIGVAISDPRQTIASPLDNHQRGNETSDARYFKRIVAEEEVVLFVVGLPVHTSGAESQKSQEARQFGAWLNATTNVPVTFYDERYTSSAAQEMLIEAGLSAKKRKARLDKIAATLILSAYLEAGENRGQEPGSLE